jgi:hypothetical protein
MNFSSENLVVECKLRFDLLIQQNSDQQQQQQTNDVHYLLMISKEIENSLKNQLQVLFGATAGTISILHHQGKPKIEKMPLFTIVEKQHQQKEEKERRRQRDENEEESKQQHGGKEKRVPIVHLVNILVTAVLERQYVQQLRAACASIVSVPEINTVTTTNSSNNKKTNQQQQVEEHMVRVSVIGKPKKCLVQKV